MTNIIFSILVVIAIFSGMYLWMRGSESGTRQEATPHKQEITNNAMQSQMQETAVTELEAETISEGVGDRVSRAGDTLAMHYTGMLLNGTKFDSSLDRGEPFEFTLGAGQVIAGWDEGLVGMKVGEKRKLTIPSDKAYGPRAIGSIPANSTLVFEVELVSIQ